jgi:hypothetical protein
MNEMLTGCSVYDTNTDVLPEPSAALSILLPDVEMGILLPRGKCWL